MLFWQKITVIIWGIISLVLFIKGLHESKNKRNVYGLTPYLLPWGIFVWGDAVIFGFFWFLISISCLILNNWILFLLIISVFWVVRSYGETIYWFNQQFSKINRNPPKILLFYKYFHNDSVWFIYQIIWQCVTAVSIITAIYLSHLWLKSI
ncbi:hypothetical protein A2159_00875 [Candidatus Woesebacteria bacterium RBG_13_34_9]|uniref:Uncharacterized protein n=1 Tax=Candidatus Woesebacteria bacterium RBG_13_34_9 TaxID=1802477 RepID=A0A1F7X2Z7_9BACT|nr:MAG: hypothetical protein A2159_00875 [Candidatus Woesebacteria bacterium RBG_13_34_9]